MPTPFTPFPRSPLIALSRLGAIACGAALIWTALPAERAAAQTIYPWCVYQGGGRDGSATTNCGYATYEQCRAAAMGTGFCAANPAATVAPPHEPQPAPRRRRN